MRYHRIVRRQLIGAWRLSALVTSALLLLIGPATAAEADPATEVAELLDRAEVLMRLGVSESGAGRSFEEALELVDAAAADLPQVRPEKRLDLARQVEAVRRDAAALSELYRERFFGTFPLARLVIPTLLIDDGFAVTEQLYHPPGMAALEVAARGLVRKIPRDVIPLLCIRIASGDKELGAYAADVFLRAGAAAVVSRRQLVGALSVEELAAFDRGDIDPPLVERLLTVFDAATLMVVTVRESFEVDRSTVGVVLEGDFLETGELIQGSPESASVAVLVAKVSSRAFSRDRRGAFWLIIAAQLTMLALTMAGSARVAWNIGTSSRVFFRLMMGVALFLFGRVFIVLVVVVMRRVLPPATAMVAAAWWWPAALGLLAILGGGIVAWFGSARLTDILPTASGERAVGSIFGLTAVGSSSYFVAPLLLLDSFHGFHSLVPFMFMSSGLAMLFGYAARTGPPVPHFFMLGPLLAAPLGGIALLMSSPAKLWSLVAVTGLLWLAAWARHRYAVAHGIEEDELSPEEAAAADRERLVKLADGLKKKL